MTSSHAEGVEELEEELDERQRGGMPVLDEAFPRSPGSVSSINAPGVALSAVAVRGQPIYEDD